MKQFFKTQNEFVIINDDLRSKSHLRPRPSINKVLKHPDKTTRDSSEEITLPSLPNHRDPVSDYLSKNTNSNLYTPTPQRDHYMNIRTTMSSRHHESSKYDFGNHHI